MEIDEAKKGSKESKHDIGGKSFLMRPLVLGQIDQLIDCLEGLTMPKTFSPMAIKKALGEKFYTALAIVLIPMGEGRNGGRLGEASLPIREILKNKDVPALAEELRWSMDHDVAAEVIESFLSWNPPASILNRLTEATLKLTGKNLRPSPANPDNGSGTLLPSSAKETSQSETKSSGDTHPETALPSPDIL